MGPYRGIYDAAGAVRRASKVKGIWASIRSRTARTKVARDAGAADHKVVRWVVCPSNLYGVAAGGVHKVMLSMARRMVASSLPSGQV